MKIYVIRHGQTTWNLSKRLQGRSDTELNEEGIQKAILTGQAFREVSFDMAFTSPLKRARQTAELFLQGRTVPIVEDERLIEISFGDYEGLSCREDHYEIPDPAFMNFFRNPDKYQVPPGGESLQSLGLRTRAFMEEIMSRPELSDKTILISSHGCASRGILNSIREFELFDFWHGGVPKNCSVALIEVKNGMPELIFENRVFYEEDPARMATY